MKERYFSHDANARIDPKILKLRMRYGMEGYGIYFAILEMMFGEPDNALPFNDDQFDAISYDLHTDLDMGAFIRACIEFGLFEADETNFWSPSFRRRMSEIKSRSDERSKKASEAARARWDKGSTDLSPKAENAQNGHSGASDDVDKGWLNFETEYEKKIGLIPYDKLRTFNDYYDAFGEEIMLLALEQTVKAKPDRPVPFMIAILQRWIEDGVNSVQKAKASIRDHERAVEQAKGKTEQKPATVDVGKFY